MERNGRLLSLPARAESALSAGTFDPRQASLPEQPKFGVSGQLHSKTNANASSYPDVTVNGSTLVEPHNPFQPWQHQPRKQSYSRVALPAPSHSNPFLPNTPDNVFDPSSQTIAAPSFARSSQSATSLAAHSVTRAQRRQLEKKAGRINIYDLGSSSANLLEAFGSKWNAWHTWIPVGISRGTGYEFPVNKQNLRKLMKINEQLRSSISRGL